MVASIFRNSDSTFNQGSKVKVTLWGSPTDSLMGEFVSVFCMGGEQGGLGCYCGRRIFEFKEIGKTFIPQFYL